MYYNCQAIVRNLWARIRDVSHSMNDNEPWHFRLKDVWSSYRPTLLYSLSLTGRIFGLYIGSVRSIWWPFAYLIRFVLLCETWRIASSSCWTLTGRSTSNFGVACRLLPFLCHWTIGLYPLRDWVQDHADPMTIMDVMERAVRDCAVGVLIVRFGFLFSSSRTGEFWTNFFGKLFDTDPPILNGSYKNGERLLNYCHSSPKEVLVACWPEQTLETVVSCSFSDLDYEYCRTTFCCTGRYLFEDKDQPVFMQEKDYRDFRERVDAWQSLSQQAH